MKFLSQLFIAFSLFSCTGGYTVTLAKEDLSFVAKIYDYEEKVGGGYKVSGRLRISNNGTSPALYSNKDLYLLIRNEGESRTYLDSIASQTVDFTDVQVENGKHLELKVYWVLPPVKSLKAENVELEWRI